MAKVTEGTHEQVALGSSVLSHAAWEKKELLFYVQALSKGTDEDTPQFPNMFSWAPGNGLVLLSSSLQICIGRRAGEKAFVVQ